MRILSIADFHGAKQTLPRLNRKIIELHPDVIVFSGDIVKGTARGDEWLQAKAEGRLPRKNLSKIKREKKEDIELYKYFYRTINKEHPVLVVPGNMDAPESRYFAQTLNLTRIIPLHENFYLHGGIVFVGFGGEITSEERERYFVHQYSKEEAEFALRKLKWIDKPKVLVLHTPPESKLGLDKGKQKGSAVVNELIAELKPLLVFCGHAHHAAGKQKIKDTLCVNPGALKYGSVALVDTATLEVEWYELETTA